ncbi:MAG: hypothetical protein AAF363_19195 [Bacteroidota bacterium]
MKAKKTISLLLAFLVAFSSTGFTLHKHYCLGVLKSVSFEPQKQLCAEKCGFKEFADPMPCCEHTVEHFKADDFSTLASLEIDLSSDWMFIAPVALENLLLLIKSDKDYTNYRLYEPPPLIDVDLQVKHQSFLI